MSQNDEIRTRAAEGRALLEGHRDDLERVHAGVRRASEVGVLLHQVEGDIDRALIAEIEALIRATMSTLPLLQQAEADVLVHLATEREQPVDAGVVQRLAISRSTSMTAAMDLHRGLALAYEKQIEAE